MFDFDDRTVFRETAMRLYAALLGRGYSNTPPPAVLLDSLSECFEMQDFQLARALTLPSQPINWHLIRIGSGGESLLECVDQLTIAPSLIRALAALQLEMDHARVFAHEVTRSDQGICLHARGGELIATIEPIPLQPADLQKRQCVNDLVQGLRIHRDRATFIQRLSTLRGLENLQGDLMPRDEDAAIGAMAVATVNNQCIAMRQMLSEFHDIEVEPAAARALVATAFGGVTWETYIARRDTAPESLMPAAIVHWGQHQSVTQARVALYSTVAESVFAFAQFCEHAVPRVFPVFSDVNRTGYCYGPRLQADETPYEQARLPPWRSRHRCTHLSLLECDWGAEARASAYFADTASSIDRVREFFLTEGSTHDRLRASNRRLGTQGSDELFIGNWLFTTWQHDLIPEDRYLIIERFSADRRLQSETVSLREALCIREANGQWRIVTEHGKRNVVLDGLTDGEIHRMTEKFAMTSTWRKAGAAPPDLT